MRLKFFLINTLIRLSRSTERSALKERGIPIVANKIFGCCFAIIKSRNEWKMQQGHDRLSTVHVT